MSSAGEVFEVNTLLRTYLLTGSASCTLFVIDYSKVVYYLDCTLGTGLLALHTTDTTVGASLVCYSALIIAGALNNYTGRFAYDMNNAVRTSLCTKTASYTLGRINVCNTVLGVDSNCILRTYCDLLAFSFSVPSLCP